ncbi:MAG: TetR/AcrR family transcriptional regulator [Erysipelotrichaceae bacterium]|nr:TetR/AcrR family transcriptional regulator [Erysipelotrichaceae bacterium]
MKNSVKAEERIFEAFIALLKKEDFDSISVKELLIDANVSKATFYRIYEDKYDLLNRSLLFATKKYVEPEKYSIDEWREMIKDLLNRLKASRTLKMFYQHSTYPQFFNVHHQFFEELIHSRIERCNRQYDESLNLEIDMTASACASALYYWMKNDFILSVDMLIERTYKMIPASLRESLKL